MNQKDSQTNNFAKLRLQAAISTQVGEFVSKIYELNTIDDVFDLLIKHLYELTTFGEMIYLKFNSETEELKLDFSYGSSKESFPEFSFNIFEAPDKNIIDAIFKRKISSVVGGIKAINDLSVRLDIDNYVIIPLILHAEDEFMTEGIACENIASAVVTENDAFMYVKERAMLKTVNFSFAGIFVFDCGSKMTIQETEDNIKLAEKLFRLASMKINNILIINNLRKAAEKSGKEMDSARAVQDKLLPAKLPNNNDIQAFASYTPAEGIGGDFYDLFLLDDGIYGVLIADVSGHGTSAALIMSAATVLFRTIASKDLNPSETIKRLNEKIIKHIPANRYLTAFYAILDIRKQKMTYTCAGHCPQFLYNKVSKEYQQFQSDGFFVGMFPELELPIHEYYYRKGENRLCLYTDGVTDCFCRDRSQFGLIRLKTVIAKTLALDTDKIINEVEHEIASFAGNADFEDDITMLIVDF